MFLFRSPQPATIQRLLDAQARLSLTYEGAGKTAHAPMPPGYYVHHLRVRLGKGPEVFAVACAVLEGWQQLRLGWLGAWPASTPIREGEVVAVVAHVFGLWWLNACRIVHVVDREGEPRRFGFAYGTLPWHAASGEEQFLIEMDAEGEVWYDILSFSKPRNMLFRLVRPLMRRVQKRFLRDSAARVKMLVQSSVPMETAS